MQPVQIEFLDNTEETAPALADIISETGGETKQVQPGSDDVFVGRIPAELDENPDIADVFLIGGQTLLFDDSVTEEGLKAAVVQPVVGADDFIFSQEEQNLVINAFNDLQNGNLNEVSADDVIDEFIADDDLVG